MPPDWSRRRVLQFGSSTGLGLLAGCSTGFDGVKTTSEAPTESPAPTPVRPDIGFSVEPLESPRRLRITVTNKSDTSITYLGGFYPFDENTMPGEVFLVPDDTEGLVPTDEQRENLDVPLVPETRTEGCLTVEYYNIMWAQPEAIFELQPDTSISERYTLVDGPSNGCYPRDSYIFSENRTIQSKSDFYDVTVAFTVLVYSGALKVNAQKPTITKSASR